ncbi:hypothetical protein PM082_001560 [Marasmius tenuissimus]|nr:hypothetical protein PM082_001560 [Marasmius tenuissimus]
MATLKKHRRCPANAIPPPEIQISDLFKLDVDDVIWQDIGLGDDDDVIPPPWMADENVRKGIRSLLEKDQCQEEITRLQHERNSIQTWFAEEWQALTQAITKCNDISYLFNARKQKLVQLCTTWQNALGLLHASKDTDPWGPTEEEIQGVRHNIGATVAKEMETIPVSVTFDSTQDGGEEDIEDLDLDSNDEVFDLGFEDEVDMGITEYLDTLQLEDRG